MYAMLCTNGLEEIGRLFLDLRMEMLMMSIIIEVILRG